METIDPLYPSKYEETLRQSDELATPDSIESKGEVNELEEETAELDEAEKPQKKSKRIM